MLNLSFKFIKNLKRNLFPFYKSKELKFVFKKLQEDYPQEKVVARFVGGCVRKHLKGDKIDDIDIATTLSADEIKQKFQNTNYKIIDTGIKHGTITLISKTLKLELTTLRKDVETYGRHAQVEYIDDWKLDSERRDFTINAIYLDINGKIYDPQMGRVDLRNNNIKFIGDPQKRIEEDYLRIIRLIRFKLMYKNPLEASTAKVIKLNLDGIQKISKERILIELLKILDLKNFSLINEDANLKEIFTLIFPEFMYLERLDKLKKVSGYSEVSKDLILAVLLINEKNNHEYFSHKYNVSNTTKDHLNLLSNNLKQLKEKDYFDKEIEKNIYINGKNHLISLNILNFILNSKSKLSNFLKNLKNIKNSKTHIFPIDGKYLIDSGMKEGFALGKTLKSIETEWLDNNFKISDKRIKEIIKQNSI